jgi:hypothetical protein
MGLFFFLFFVQKTARFSFVARLNVIGFVGPGWATKRNAIGFDL